MYGSMGGQWGSRMGSDKWDSRGHRLPPPEIRTGEDLT